MNRRIKHRVRGVYPITSYQEHSVGFSSVWGAFGTAFFISSEGHFITAAHVARDKKESLEMRVMLFNRPVQKWHLLEVEELKFHPTLDIAIGKTVVPNVRDWNLEVLPISERLARDEEDMVTFGYAKTNMKSVPKDSSLVIDMHPKVYQLKILEYKPYYRPVGGPTYMVSDDPGAGISGAPLLNKNHEVMGVASRGSGPYLAFTDIRAILNWTIPFEGKNLREMSQEGLVKLRRPEVFR